MRCPETSLPVSATSSAGLSWPQCGCVYDPVRGMSPRIPPPEPPGGPPPLDRVIDSSSPLHRLTPLARLGLFIPALGLSHWLGVELISPRITSPPCGP